MAAELVELQEMLQGVAAGIVDHPSDVSVTCSPVEVEGNGNGRRPVMVTLATNQGDTGNIIGRGGRVIQSIRTILEAWGGRHGVSVHLNYATEKSRKRRIA
tara:strand:+ start:6620 stop:6922 length:303 start_codon:yes stop_codon:yes gene_type:complete